MDKLQALTWYFNKKKVKFSCDNDYRARAVDTTTRAEGGSFQNLEKITIQVWPANCGMKLITYPYLRNEENFLGLLEYVKYKLGSNVGKPGLLVVTLNKSQDNYRKVFIKAGFKVLWEGINPLHGPNHMICMLGYDLYNYNKNIQKDEMSSVRLHSE